MTRETEQCTFPGLRSRREWRPRTIQFSIVVGGFLYPRLFFHVGVGCFYGQFFVEPS